MAEENDPLLPRGAPAPEIMNSIGSQPQSMSDEYPQVYDDNVRPRRGVKEIIIIFVTTIVGVFIIFSTLGQGSSKEPFGSKPKLTITQRVDKILGETPLIDGHNDLAILLRFAFNNHIYDKNFTEPFENGGLMMHVDLPRLKKGKNGGAFWSAFVPCPPPGLDFSDETYAACKVPVFHSFMILLRKFLLINFPKHLNTRSISYYNHLIIILILPAVRFTYNQIDLLHRLRAAYPDTFSLPPNSSTALSAFQSNQLISPLAIEGLHQIGNSLSNLRNFYGLGVRYATLTHNCHNRYADAAILELPGGGIEKSTPHWGGVSTAGQKLVQEMNRLGMIVDLAHVSQDTMRDVLGGNTTKWAGSAAPIIFSHSSAYSLCPHPRNVPDDILQLVKKTNSVVMVNFSPDFVSCVPSGNKNGIPDFYPANSTLGHVVEHIMHIGELIGYEHVGLGSDFDGIPSTPEGLDDVSKFPDLVAELLSRGVSDKQAAGIVGGNVLRVWTDVDKVALKMQKEGVSPIEDDLPDLKIESLI